MAWQYLKLGGASKIVTKEMAKKASGVVRRARRVAKEEAGMAGIWRGVEH